ncbi:MAG: hemerythrin domain-containing protein [Dehalococcoidia bacterium]|nr:hemerythrin domain-containing protein [Dehalococcoidia bacterium]
MPLPTQPLRDEHKYLFPHVETLRIAADSVGAATPADLRARVDEAYEFLTRHLIPHAHAEDKVLYPAIAKAMGAARATATMSRDHVEVGRLTDEVGRLRARLAKGALSKADEAPEALPEEVAALIEQREAARRRRDWTLADALRERLAGLGYRVIDTPEGPRREAMSARSSQGGLAL